MACLLYHKLFNGNDKICVDFSRNGWSKGSGKSKNILGQAALLNNYTK